jgi:hypothetical protein
MDEQENKAPITDQNEAVENPKPQAKAPVKKAAAEKAEKAENQVEKTGSSAEDKSED